MHTTKRIFHGRSTLNLCRRSSSTHTVFNQAYPLENYNAFLNDPLLLEASPTWAKDHLTKFGSQTGSEEWLYKARVANRVSPILHTHDRFGLRSDKIEFHPYYHELMKLGLENGVSAFAWNNENKIDSQVARGIACHLMYQLESGVSCPLTMTYAALPALRHTKGSFGKLLTSKLTSCNYDSSFQPLNLKNGGTIGMSMTEKQGGSDVRSNTTRANPLDSNNTGDGSLYNLIGHKWFTSAPMSDAFLTLAQTGQGVSCFIVPRFLENGQKNEGFQIQRLKDKLGDRSNASGEIEYHNAHGYLLGERNKGIKTIVEMVVHTRLDCTIGSASLIRLCAQQAAFHVKHRSAFGKVLIDQPLMNGVIADLGLESEACVSNWIRLAKAFDNAQKGNEDEALFLRVATAISKYWVCKRAPLVAFESIECFGGNGYIEDGIMARLFRQSPLNAIWEGSGNVICLDVLRAMKKEPQSLNVLLKELDKTFGVHSKLDELILDIKKELKIDSTNLESRARGIIDKMALALQASILLSRKDKRIGEAFVNTRIASGVRVGNFGNNLIEKETQQLIIDRLIPM